MAGNIVDPQHSWADLSETEENMEIADIPSYAQMVGRRRHSSVSSQSGVDYIMRNAERLTDAEKDSIHPLNILPERPCTAHFSLSDKDTSLSQVFADLKNCGIRAAAVRCLQRNPNGFVSVTFSTSEYRDLFLRKSSFIRRHRNSSSTCTFVVVYDTPFELSDEALAHRLSRYGSVLGFRRCNLQGYEGIKNGTRVARMELSESIPSFLRFGRKLLRVKHEGQVPTCRKCHLPDHVAKVCPNVICFNCDQLGHTFSDCKEEIKCSICKEDGHYAIDCKLSWWRRPEKVDTGDNDAAPAPLLESRPSQSPPQPPPDEPSSDGPPSSIPLEQSLPDIPPSQPPTQSSPDVLPPTPSCVPLSSQSSLSPSSGQPSSLSQNTPKQPSTQPSQSSQSTQFSQSSQTTQSSQSLLSPVESSSLSPPLSQEPSLPSSIISGSPTLSDLQLVAAADSQRSTASDQAIAAMEIPEDPGPTVPLRPSQIPIRPQPLRVAPKRKPARLDFTDGPPPRKSTSPMPVSSSKKTKNPHPS